MREFRSVRDIAVFLSLILVFSVACKRIEPTDTTALDNAGMDYSSIQTLRGLDITNAEVAELAKAKQAGLSDDGCVELVRIARGRKEAFRDGGAVSALLQAGVKEPTILELARLDQLGLESGELQAMRLAGLSDQILLEFARRRAAGKPVLSGASLAGLKNTGMSLATLLELVRRGIPDDQARTIIRLRHRGMSETEILRRYPAS